MIRIFDRGRVRFANYGLQPRLQLLSRFAWPKNPCVVMIPKTGRSKRQVRIGCLLPKVASCVLDLVFLSADELGSAIQSLQSQCRGCRVAIWVWPNADTIVVAVRYKGSP